MQEEKCFNFFDVEYIYGFVWWGVCKQSRWRHSVTEPSQDGGYVLLWQRYGNNKMVAMRYYGNVMTTTMSQHSFYIFNSTVIDWTCFVFFSYNENRLTMASLYKYIFLTGPASWLGGRSSWLINMRSGVRFPALPCTFFLERGRRPWWPWSG